MVKKWKYFSKKEEIDELYIENGQYMAGNVLGIVLLEKNEEYSVNSVRNAQKYDYPVRYEVVEKVENDAEFAITVLQKIKELNKQGCRGIILADEEFCRIYEQIIENTELITLVSMLQVIPFAVTCTNKNLKVCVVSNHDKETVTNNIKNLGLGEYLCRCVIADSKLSEITNISEIGCIIWDEENFDDLNNCYMKKTNKNIPTYTYVKVAKLLKMGLVQIPYEGWI